MKIHTVFILFNLIFVIIYLSCQLGKEEMVGKILLVILCAASCLFIYLRTLIISCANSMKKLDTGLKKMNEKFVNLMANREIVENMDNYIGDGERESEKNK
jgi:hypothetical protein